MFHERPGENQDYRQEARNIRAKAREVRDAEARSQLLLIASLYDKLANLTKILVPALRAKLPEKTRMKSTEGTDGL
jgi:hypothetical protein